MKGLLSNIGREGKLCQGFKALSLVQMMASIRFKMLNGTMPSMTFECNFKMQEEDPIAGNYFRARIFRENANVHWKEFKLCFSLVDFRVFLPSKKVSSN